MTHRWLIVLALLLAAMPAIASKQDRLCIPAAAKRYGIPALVLYAVAKTEGGQPGTKSLNDNGTHDLGRMQFNTAYLATIGVSASDVQAPGCYPYYLAAWRLRKHLKTEEGDVWTRAAYYHSRTPKFNQIYAARLRAHAIRIVERK